MSGRIVGEVRRNAPRDMGPSARLVLAYLAESARERDRICRYYPIEALAWDCGLNLRNTKKIVADLAERGLVVRLVDRVELRKGRTQQYFIPPLVEHHQQALLGPVRGDPPEPRQGVTHDTLNGHARVSHTTPNRVSQTTPKGVVDNS